MSLFSRVGRFLMGPSSRLSAGLALITVCLVLTADLVGLLPNSQKALIEARAGIIEQSAGVLQQLVRRDDTGGLDTFVSATVTRYSQLEGMAVKAADGAMLAVAGEVPLDAFVAPDEDFAIVNLKLGGEPWAEIGYAFEPFGISGPLGWLWTPVAKLMYFLAAIGYCFYAFFLRRVLQHLDPTAIMPQRVRTIMDTLTEGTVLIDTDSRIVMANLAFARMVEMPIKGLTGTNIAAFDWTHASDEASEMLYMPWDSAIGAGTVVEGRSLSLTISKRGLRHYLVNVAPIFDTKERCKGALVTFDDRTEMVRANAELKSALSKLDEQRKAIERQNKELKKMATRDPLTGCLNRRAFFEIFEREFLAAQKRAQPLSCIMCDIDHFKAINDNYGHAAGDRVIQEVAAAVNGALRDSDHLCRYGGEEFCVILPRTQQSEAEAIAERIRKIVESSAGTKMRLTGDARITSSFGVASLSATVTDLHELVDNADQALYFSKQNGRNRVSSYQHASKRGDEKVVSLNG